MARRFIDLSMAVHNDMMAFPRVVRPSMAMYETWEEFAERIGAAAYGMKSLAASSMFVSGDHIGTHIEHSGISERAVRAPMPYLSNTVMATAYVWTSVIFL